MQRLRRRSDAAAAAAADTAGIKSNTRSLCSACASSRLHSGRRCKRDIHMGNDSGVGTLSSRGKQRLGPRGSPRRKAVTQGTTDAGDELTAQKTTQGKSCITSSSHGTLDTVFVIK
ncbi:hypothetical protein JOB18_000150 [Solea senegalensis]|uniref:Uncharacterized protein n=1 Tax=Solea senegalensis TaxID=28829 RepID=A0AAV6R2Z9_SOLSE|nr:hypothetical protein JOB18_000150 [Solea senegalensis]